MSKDLKTRAAEDPEQLWIDLAQDATSGAMNDAQRSVWGFLQCSLQNIIDQPDSELMRTFLDVDLARYEAARATVTGG